MICGPEVPHLPRTPHGMQASLTVCEVGGHQLQQALLIQTGQQSGDIPTQTEAQLHREEPGGAVLRLFDECDGRHGALQ